MVNNAPSMRSLFEQALELASAAERTAFLDDACLGNTELRSSVESLLRAHADAGSFLAHPAWDTETADLNTTAPAGIGISPSAPAVPDPPFDLSLDFLAPPEVSGALGRLNQYDIFEVLGHGGMGIVLRGHDSRLDRSVAIKVASPLLAVRASGRQRFLREAKAAAAVRHDHVVTIHDVGEVKGLPYLVMELVAGDSLQRRIDQHGPPDLPEMLRIGMQTALGLAAAHAQGLVHRDIKPANILLASAPDRAKISDFGLARVTDDVSITQTDVVAGTPQYMAPEQARGEAVDHRADLFSLGSVLYAMCTGQAPYRASSALLVLRHVCEDQPQPISELNPAIPAWLIAIVDKLHSKNPCDRFQSASEVAELLGQGLAHQAQPATTPQPQVPVVASVGRHGSDRDRRWPLAIAAASLVIGGFIVTEAAGVTNFALTIIRIAQGGGTLVIEIDDPGVTVNVDDEAVIITGAGPSEVRVTPGKHTVRFSRDDQTLDEQIVTVARGGRDIVRITREQSAAPQSDGDSPWKEWPKDAPPPAVAPFDDEQAQQHQQAWASYLGVPVEYVNSLGMKLRIVPPGEFVMGTSTQDILELQQLARASGWPDWEIKELAFEAPQRLARVDDPYYIGTCEVTVRNFRAFVESAQYLTTAERTRDGGWASYNGQWVRRPEHIWKSPAPWELLDDQPVVQLSGRDAEAFCKWLSEREGLEYSLPREVQWEMASRAGTTNLYGFSNDPDSVREFAWTHANLPADRPGQPQPVGLKTANPFGVHDILGNVWEMCSDVHSGLAGRCVSRGGAYTNQWIRHRPASRGAADPERAWDCALGFRVVITGDLDGVKSRAEEVSDDSESKRAVPANDASTAEETITPTSNN